MTATDGNRNSWWVRPVYAGAFVLFLSSFVQVVARPGRLSGFELGLVGVVSALGMVFCLVKAIES